MKKVTKEQIKEWEKEHGDLKTIVLPAVVKEVKDSDGIPEEKEIHPEATFYLKRPNRSLIKYAKTLEINKDGRLDMVTSGEVILKKCYLGGDDVSTDDHYYFRACKECYSYMLEIEGF